MATSAAYSRDMAHPANGAPAQHQYQSFGYLPGERVADTSFKDIDGKPATLASLAGAQGAVLVVRDTTCAVSQNDTPGLAQLEPEFSAKGFNFIYVDIAAHDATEARADAQLHKLKGRVVLDTERRLIDALRVSAAGEVFLIDGQGTLRYRGAIDDQYSVEHGKDVPANNWLRKALNQLMARQTIAIDSTPAPGCPLKVDMDAPGKARPVTYYNRISRIIQRKCETCHREGGFAPMPLQNYKQVLERAAMIDYMTSSRLMPPWGASHHVGAWANDASLTGHDLADLHAWIKSGAPAGKKSEAPIAREFTPGWAMEKPDAILQIPDQFRVPAQGIVAYKYSYLKTNFDTDKWVSQIEIQPTAPRVVHHALFFVEEPGRKGYNDPTRKPGDPLPNDGGEGFFGGTAPGFPMMVFPEGTAKKLPKGAWLKFVIHYQPNGVEQSDQTQVAFKFVDEPASSQDKLKEVQTNSAFNGDFAIPPGDANYEIRSEYAFKSAGTLISVMPHAHLRSKAWQVWLVAQDGTKTMLLDVPHFDFNWQTYYKFKQPIHVEPGMTLLAKSWYDNSAGNPFNPDPTKTVRLGEQTFDEMMICYFDWVADTKQDTGAVNAN